MRSNEEMFTKPNDTVTGKQAENLLHKFTQQDKELSVEEYFEIGRAG